MDMNIKVDSESFFYRNMLTHRWLNFVLLVALLITVFYFYSFVYMVVIFAYFSLFFGFLATIKIRVNGRKCDYAFSWIFFFVDLFYCFLRKRYSEDSFLVEYDDRNAFCLCFSIICI